MHGPYEPEKGLRFNPSKLLIDPYARALAGGLDWNAPLFGYKIGETDDLVPDERDDACGVPKCVVTTSHFDWENDRPPLTPWHETIIYELHVKGFTARLPGHSRRAARHLRRPGAPRLHRLPEETSASPPSS